MSILIHVNVLVSNVFDVSRTAENVLYLCQNLPTKMGMKENWNERKWMVVGLEGKELEYLDCPLSFGYTHITCSSLYLSYQISVSCLITNKSCLCLLCFMFLSFCICFLFLCSHVPNNLASVYQNAL